MLSQLLLPRHCVRNFPRIPQQIIRKSYATTIMEGAKFNHTMLRIKEPSRSIAFYELLGMKLINKMSQPEAKFDLYFLAYDGPNSASQGKHWTDREGVIELTHNYGTENDDNYTVNNGNKDPHKGFGHVCISVDNIQAACSRLESNNVKFQKKLTDGRMRSIAFALDPDGYWVEIISTKKVADTENITETDTSCYRMNHSMIRVKDPKASLDFYQNIMGMKLLRESDNKDAGFTLYFLAYPGDYGSANNDDSANDVNPTAHREGILELTWNHGTEKESGPIYHNGNDQPQGFGHTCVSVPDLNKACEYLESKNVNWKKRLTDGRMKNVAFVLDPDQYWIEIISSNKADW